MFSRLPLSTRNALKGFLLVSPALILFAVFVYRPLIHTGILSFYDWNMVSPTRLFVGLDNYVEMLENAALGKALKNSAMYALWLMGAIIVLPILVSAGMTYLGGRIRKIYRVTLFSPTVVSLGIASVMWLWVFNPIGGLLGTIWESLGLTPLNWLSSPKTALLAIVIIVGWKAFGYNMLLLLAGLGGISNEVIDASKVDGADGVRLWIYVILPLLSPTIFFILISTLSMATEYVFTPIHVLTGGGPVNASTNVVFEIWRQAFRWFRVGYSSAIAVIVFIIFLILMVIQMWLSEKVVSYDER